MHILGRSPTFYIRIENAVVPQYYYRHMHTVADPWAWKPTKLESILFHPCRTNCSYTSTT